MPQPKARTYNGIKYGGLVLFFCLIAAPVYGQPPYATIKGRVVDKKTLQPIKRATIKITTPRGQLSGSATANNSGNYTIYEKLSGVYLIYASADGYQATYATGYLSPGKTYTFNFKLNKSPSCGIASPSNGRISPGQALTFITMYFDPNGWQDIRNASLLINSDTNLQSGFYAYYNQNTNMLYLGNSQVGYAPGSPNVIEGPYGRLDCSKTTVKGSGTTLIINWAVSFKPDFAGVKNVYLYVNDDASAYDGWDKVATLTIASQVLSISVNPKAWDIGSTEANKVVTMPGKNKITVTNEGTGPETFELKLIDPSGWKASFYPGQETYVLSGLFCNPNDTPDAGQFNRDFSNDDVITTRPQKASSVVFAYRQAPANGAAVPAGAARALYLQFKSPKITQRKEEQNLSVIVTCQIP